MTAEAEALAVDKGGSGAGAVALAVLVTMVLCSAPDGWGNGGKLRLSKAEAGPYVVSVWTRPTPARVGPLDVSVAVMDPATERPITDVRVALRGERLDGGEAVARTAAEAGRNRFGFHGDLGIPVAGRWRFTVAVEGPGGRGETAFELDVRPPRPLIWSLLPGILVALALFGWLLTRSAKTGGAG